MDGGLLLEVPFKDIRDMSMDILAQQPGTPAIITTGIGAPVKATSLCPVDEICAVLVLLKMNGHDHRNRRSRSSGIPTSTLMAKELLARAGRKCMAPEVMVTANQAEQGFAW